MQTAVPFFIKWIRQWVTEVIPSPEEVCAAKEKKDHAKDDDDRSRVLESAHDDDREQHQRREDDSLRANESSHESTQGEGEHQPKAWILLLNQEQSQGPGGCGGEGKERRPEVSSYIGESSSNGEIKSA